MKVTVKVNAKIDYEKVYQLATEVLRELVTAINRDDEQEVLNLCMKPFYADYDYVPVLLPKDTLK